MDAESVDRFGEQLSVVGASSIRTTADQFPSMVTEAISSPAVGAPLRIDGLTLDDTPVTLDPSPADLVAAETGVTAAFLGIAESGTVAIESTADGDELISLYPHRHVVVVPASRLYDSLDEALSHVAVAFEAGRDSLVFVTGTSATADMGATVEGVHGPGEVIVIIVEDR